MVLVMAEGRELRGYRLNAWLYRRSLKICLRKKEASSGSIVLCEADLNPEGNLHLLTEKLGPCKTTTTNRET